MYRCVCECVCEWFVCGCVRAYESACVCVCVWGVCLSMRGGNV